MMRAAIYVVLGVLMGIGAAACSSSTSAQGPSGKLNLVVVCVSCIPDDMPQEAYNSGNILLDQNTGDLWFYPALSPGVKPRLMGTQKSDSPA